MEPIHLLMDIALPPLFFILMLAILPPSLVFRFVVTIYRMFTMEDLTGKVVLITGASSGIGEELAYEYAKQGACLSLIARRENILLKVAEKARGFGSPDVIIIRADVSKQSDCTRFVEETVSHFGRLDHLVNNAGIMGIFHFNKLTNIANALPVMDVNFWGSVYPTHFALPHLRNSRGKIVVIASPAGWLYAPLISFYGASKAALVNFYETLRVEFGSSVKITIASPGFTESEMTQGKNFTMEGTVEIDSEKTVNGIIPLKSASSCAKVIVNAVRRGDRHVTDPSWYRILYICKAFIPEMVEWFFRLYFVTMPKVNMKNAQLGKISSDDDEIKKYC